MLQCLQPDTHHSDDIVEIFHGMERPLVLCGFHGSQVHNDGEPHKCSATCTGPHYGQQYDGEICPRCGGNRYGCLSGVCVP